MGIKPHIIEMDGAVWSVSGNQVQAVDRFESVPGDKRLMIDFPSGLSRVMTVEAPFKYAETMVVRKLQEEGEFDESVTILTHWKKKRGPKNTQVFFTAVSTDTYIRFTDRIQEHGHTVVFFPLYQVLYHFLTKAAGKSPAAVVFHHDRFADIIIGSSRKVLLASRCTAFDTTPDQIESLWDMVMTDISAAENDHDLTIDRIFLLNWMDTALTLPESSTPDRFLTVNQAPVFYQGNPCSATFLKAAGMLPVHRGTVSKSGLLLYALRKGAFLAVFLFFIACLGITGLYWKVDHAADLIGRQIAQTEDRISQLRKTVSIQPANIRFDPTFAFVTELSTIRNTPSFKQILSDIQAGLFQPAVLKNVAVSYTGREVKIELYGSVNSGFDNAYKGYQSFVRHLEETGYQIEKSDFNTRINLSEFKLVFLRSIR